MKNYYMTFRSITTVLALLVVISSGAHAGSKHDKHLEIWSVITTFKEAIAHKEKEKFLALFTEENVSWVGVISDQTRSLLISKDKRFSQQPQIINSTPEKFIDDIVNDTNVSRETFDKVRIIADNNVASVVFDYVFYKSDMKNNWGQENWQLVKTDKGWKINAVNFSYTINPDALAAKKTTKQ